MPKACSLSVSGLGSSDEIRLVINTAIDAVLSPPLGTCKPSRAGPCGETEIDFTEPGRGDMPVTVTSPGWPNHYPNKVVCVYFLTAQPGHRVVITLQDMDIQPDWDYVAFGNTHRILAYTSSLSG